MMYFERQNCTSRTHPLPSRARPTNPPTQRPFWSTRHPLAKPVGGRVRKASSRKCFEPAVLEVGLVDLAAIVFARQKAYSTVARGFWGVLMHGVFLHFCRPRSSFAGGKGRGRGCEPSERNRYLKQHMFLWRVLD